MVVSNIFFWEFSPPNIGEDEPHFGSYFAKGLVQPPTRWKIHMEPIIEKEKHLPKPSISGSMLIFRGVFAV